MDEHKYKRKDPWEPGMYETGRTRPPKSHGGLIAVLLVVVIFLCGLVSALGVVNVKLFAQLNELSKPREDDLSFINEELDSTAPTAQEPAPTAETAPLQQISTGESFVLNPSPESVPNVMQEGGLPLQQIYDKVIPSVVSISAVGNSGSSTGTGVILSTEGYIVTNCHVVDGARQITVLLTDDRSFTAKLIGADDVSDLAVLRIQATDIIPAEFGDSSVLRVGDSVAAIGDPLGEALRGTLTNGIVSAINRDVTTGGRTLTLIQTNAALNSGNSGGPLINCYGQVIGINTTHIAAGDAADSIGFAIPSATVKDIVDQLIAHGYVSGRPTLGLSGEAVTKFDQYYFHIPQGLYIDTVAPGSDAYRQGISSGDILVSINAQPINDQKMLDSLVNSLNIGDIVTAVFFIDGEEKTMTLTVTEYTG